MQNIILRTTIFAVLITIVNLPWLRGGHEQITPLVFVVVNIFSLTGVYFIGQFVTWREMTRKD